ncbi:DMT family transporter [Palleronia caenipelagi]|uniref:DMT family transporter n=2 Tax=Palleronia caenipelagi TaxID=2489174 RepID=A0A547Q358_9RHOB|nr:DMT family transporter [Palleronia caenipelagi]
MVLTGFCFVAVNILVKALGGGIPAGEAAFLRYIIGILLLLPLMLREPLRVSRTQMRVFAIRGVFQAAGVVFWFYAMTRISLAEVQVLNYLSPVYITIGAALFLGERFSWIRGLAILAALVGVILILRPGIRPIDPGHIAMLATALCFAGSYLMAKSLSGGASPTLVVIMLSLWTGLFLAPVALIEWVWPSMAQLGVLALVAAAATAGHFTMTLAFRSAPISVTQPLVFLQLVWATLAGWYLFDEKVDSYVIGGGTIIIAAVVTISIREARTRRQRSQKDTSPS